MSPLNRCQQNPSPVATVRTDQRLVAYTAQSRCYTLPGDEKCEHASHWVKTKVPAQLHTSSDSERESCSFALLLSWGSVLLRCQLPPYSPLCLLTSHLQNFTLIFLQIFFLFTKFLSHVCVASFFHSGVCVLSSLISRSLSC